MVNRKIKRKMTPNRLIWFFYKILARKFVKKNFYLELDKEEFDKRNKDEGCLVLYNHNCNSDFWIQGAVYQKSHANMVVTKRFKYIGYRNFFLKRCKTILREQFVPDVNSILQMKRSFECGNIVGLAPTGTVTIHGGSYPIFPATIKLIKKFKVDVYYMLSLGSYIAEPKWAVNKRKYPVKTKVFKIFSKEDLETLSNEECMDRLMKYANICDENTRVYPKALIKGKNITEGLEKILYLCPRCNKQEIIYHDDMLECTNCHNKVRYNHYGYLEGIGNDYLTFHTEHEWYNYQTRYFMKQLENDNFEYNTKVLLHTDAIIKDKFIEAGWGTLHFDKKECYYEGEYLDEKRNKINKRIDFSFLVPELSYVPMLRFNIPSENGLFEFMPEDKKEVMRWVQIWEAYQIILSNNKKEE